MRLKIVFFFAFSAFGCSQMKEDNRSQMTRLILIDEKQEDINLIETGKSIIPNFYFEKDGYGNANVYVTYNHSYYDEIKRIDKTLIRDYQLIEIDTVDFNTWFYWDNEIPTFLALKQDYDDFISNEKINGLIIFEVSIYANSIE